MSKRLDVYSGIDIFILHSDELRDDIGVNISDKGVKLHGQRINGKFACVQISVGARTCARALD